MKKIITGIFIATSFVAQASWWGELSKGERAGIIGGTTAVILHSRYQGSEMHHQRKLDKIDTQIRRDYETIAVIENAHNKYHNSGVPVRLKYLTANDYCGGDYTKNKSVKSQKGKMIYNNGKTQIFELSDEKDLIIEK